MNSSLTFTIKDWNLFRAEFNKLATALALHEWEILHVFRMPDDARNRGAMACVEADINSMIATIYLNNQPMDDEDICGIPKDELLRRVARHEALELLLYKLGDLAHSRNLDYDRYESETHCIIHRLENIIKLK
jgi:hypothetical protein